jgi:hypothetical protein
MNSFLGPLPFPEPIGVPIPPMDPCSSGACVDAQVSADGTEVVVTSTIAGNDGEVRFTRDEWDQFLSDVKHSDKWDHTHTGRVLA